VTFSDTAILKVPIDSEETILESNILDSLLANLEMAGDTNLYGALELSFDVIQSFAKGGKLFYVFQLSMIMVC
jgi:hypothetical protein